MGTREPIGCLGTILRLLGIDLRGRSPAEDQELPYRLRDDFLSAAELSFFRVLAGVVQGKAVICPKVRLADLFFVARPHENQSFRNKIDRKHVDFLLCNPVTYIRCWALNWMIPAMRAPLGRNVTSSSTTSSKLPACHFFESPPVQPTLPMNFSV
jgi:hypothetical protein